MPPWQLPKKKRDLLTAASAINSILPAQVTSTDLRSDDAEIILRNRLWRYCTDRQGKRNEVYLSYDESPAPYIMVDMAKDRVDSPEAAHKWEEDVPMSYGIYNLELAEALADTLATTVGAPQLAARKIDAVQIMQRNVARELEGVMQAVEVKGELNEISKVGHIIETASAQIDWKTMVDVWREQLLIQDGVYSISRDRNGTVTGLLCPAGTE